jgi:RNA polymerase sigma-70 factor (ECF subfamily)
LGVPRADVEDVCQEVFVVVLKKLPDFDARLSLRAWIYGICVRKASDHRRLAYRAREQVTPSVPEGAVTPSQEEDVDRERARGVLDQALAELDDDRRAVFVLFEIEQLSMSDVAAALGCPLQTAYSRLYAARKQIEAAVRRQRARSAP